MLYRETVKNFYSRRSSEATVFRVRAVKCPTMNRQLRKRYQNVGACPTTGRRRSLNMKEETSLSRYVYDTGGRRCCNRAVVAAEDRPVRWAVPPVDGH